MRYEDILQAKLRLKGIVHRTPLTLSKTFSRMAGGQVYMKLENLQKTGAFKIRGAYNKIAMLSEGEKAAGIVTASAGNHAQGVASAAASYGVRSIVVMPESAPRAKVEATEGYGSTVVLCGRNYDEAYVGAQSIAKEQGAVFVHAFDDPAVIAGQGTIGLEILEELPDTDVILVPVGGGGLISGIALAAKTYRPRIRVIGVQPEQANSAVLSWKADELCSIGAPQSIADGLSVKCPGRLPFAMMRQYVDELVTVSETEIKQAMRLFLERSKLLVEGAGAVTLAAMTSGRIESAAAAAGAGGKTVLVVSGGNIDLSRIAQLA